MSSNNQPQYKRGTIVKNGKRYGFYPDGSLYRIYSTTDRPFLEIVDIEGETFLRIRQATEQGYTDCPVFGVADLNYPTSALRRSRTIGGQIGECTHGCQQQSVCVCGIINRKKIYRAKKNKIMERNDRLPNVIFLSKKASEMIESQTTENVVCLENEANGISAKNVSLCDEEVNKAAEYRNIVQLWHPAGEKPHCIGALLCWRRDGTHFVHEHFNHDEQNWRMFISEYDVLRYCYIGNLEPDSFF